MSIPSPSIRAMRSAPSARPPACRSNGVPFTTSATPSTVQCECTSMTVTRLPPMEISFRLTGPAAAAAPPPRPAPPPPPRCASTGIPRPTAYAPAAAPATVLKNSLRFCIAISLSGGVRGELQQLDQIAAEDLFLLRVVEERCVQDEIRRDRPPERHVGSVHDLARAHFRDHVPQAVFAENHAVGHQLRLEVVVDRPLLPGADIILPPALGVGASHV